MEQTKSSVTAYFDFETYNLTNFKFGEQPIEEWDKFEKLDKPTAVYGAGLWYEGVIYTFLGTNALKEWWYKLLQLAKGKSVTLIAHNCAYDFAFINEFVHTDKECSIKSFRAAQTDDERAWLWASINVDNVEIIFKDTWIWDKNCSLKWYSNILNCEVQKGKLFDYEKWNLFEEDGGIYFYDKNGNLKELDYVEERQYLSDDVALLPKVKNYIYQTKKFILKSDFMPKEEFWITPFWEINNKITKAGFAKSCLELAIGEAFYDGFKLPIDEEFYHLQEKSYIGGFTAGNKEITTLDLDEAKIHSFDVNSLYPSIMAISLPYGDVMYEPPTDKEYCTWYVITGTECEYKDKYAFLDCPIISTRFQEWLKSNKNIKGFIPKFIILKEYFEIITEYCDNNLSIVDVFYQELSTKLSQTVKDAYELRVLVKETNKPLADSIKLFLNSGYGKFGEKVHAYVIKWNEKLQCWDETQSKKCKFYTNLLTGLYVCSQGRIKLMKAIKSEIENGNTFLYADTDSIKLVVNNPVKLEIDPDKLGAWKHEGTFNIWRYPLKRKRYYSYNTFNGKEKITAGGFAKFMIEDLPYEDKLKFFSPNINVLIKGGKRTRYIGDVRKERKGEEVKLNRFGLTKLNSIDISTTNNIDEPDYIMEENAEGKWVMRPNYGDK